MWVWYLETKKEEIKTDKWLRNKDRLRIGNKSRERAREAKEITTKIS